MGRTLDAYAKAQPLLGGRPYRVPAILGSKIGEAAALPRRHALEYCESCRSMVWIDSEESDQVTGEQPLFLCRGCGAKRLAAGQMEAVPLSLLGGLS
jgi:hypothetical protein